MVAEQSRPLQGQGAVPPLVSKRWPRGVEFPAIMGAVANRPRLPEFAMAARAMRWAERRAVVMGEFVWAHCGIVLVRCPLPEPVECAVPPVLPVFAAMPWIDPASGHVDLVHLMELAALNDGSGDPVDEEGQLVLEVLVDCDGDACWAIRLDVAATLVEHGVTKLDVVWAPHPANPGIRLPFFRFRSGAVEGIVLPCGTQHGWSSEEED